MTNTADNTTIPRPFDPQQVFDQVAVHIIAQGRRAQDYGSCRYRTEDGLKCAVGCLIPDELYDPHLEGASVMRDRVQDTLNKIWTKISPAQYCLLKALQNAHDMTLESSLEGWRKEMIRIADAYGLDSSIVHKPSV